MIVYLIAEKTKELICELITVQAVYGNELHFCSTNQAKLAADKISKFIQNKLEKGESTPITYASDLAEAIVIPQKNILVIVSDSTIEKIKL